MNLQPFNQPAPELGNQYDDDRVLRSYLRRVLPQEIHREIEPALRELGDLTGGELYRLQFADLPNEPVLTLLDPMGHPIDQITIHPL